MKTSIGVPTYRGAKRLNDLLTSISLWTEKPVPPIAVLDDGSPNESARRIRLVCEDWKVPLIVHDENMGIAKSWNDLTVHFDSEIQILLNDDLLVAKDWLKALVYFVENNKCGGAGLPFYFIEPEDVPLILEGKEWIPRDPDKPRVYDSKLKRHVKPLAPYKMNQVRETMTPGKIMCASGNVQAFKRELFDKVGGFDLRFKSFFEESDMYTTLASLGYASYGLTHPYVFHCWSQTFSENPELEAGKVMRRSHLAYIDKWKVPREHWDMPFDYTNPKFMSKIPKQKVTWLGANGKKYEKWDS